MRTKSSDGNSMLPSLIANGNVKCRDDRDLALEQLADDEAGLREANRQLIDLVADLYVEISTLTLLYERELRSRVHGDATITRLQRQLHQRVV